MENIEKCGNYKKEREGKQMTLMNATMHRTRQLSILTGGRRDDR